jgi:carboxymethylenebutenolidase
MCAPFDAEPPIPPIAGAAVSHRLLELTAADGNRLAAFEAVPEEDAAIGVVILPDVRGLFHFYEELALRFAEVGVAAVAFDYFGRTAGVSQRDEDFPYMDHVAQTTAGGIQADVAAAVGQVRALPGVGSVFTVGFCFGGRHSWLAAAGGHGLDGVVGFYGRPGVGRDGEPGPIQRSDELAAPLLGLMGGADEAIPVADVTEFDRALTASGVTHDLVIYDGAPHSFFDRRFADHAEASADAWRRVLEFIGAPRR